MPDTLRLGPYALDSMGDNLDALRSLKAQGARFDLVELDGPYMAGLEDWDTMTEVQYIAHYAERLTLVRDVLQPWGVVFVFGYPEGCAEIKSWAHRTGTLYLRRWLTWYKQITAHKGRKVETILLFRKDTPSQELAGFGKFLRREREKQNWTLRDVGDKAGRDWWHRGGNLYFENGNGGYPSLDDILTLSRIFGFDLADWPGVFSESYANLTDLDFISATYLEETRELNGNGLRSKPVGLYLDLFRSTVPPTDAKRALILYGGSGNAGIAAAALGYGVTICETDSARVETIRQRWVKDVTKWTAREAAKQPALAFPEPEQLTMEIDV